MKNTLYYLAICLFSHYSYASSQAIQCLNIQSFANTQIRELLDLSFGINSDRRCEVVNRNFDLFQQYAKQFSLTLDTELEQNCYFLSALGAAYQQKQAELENCIGSSSPTDEQCNHFIKETIENELTIVNLLKFRANMLSVSNPGFCIERLFRELENSFLENNHE